MRCTQIQYIFAAVFQRHVKMQNISLEKYFPSCSVDLSIRALDCLHHLFHIRDIVGAETGSILRCRVYFNRCFSLSGNHPERKHAEKTDKHREKEMWIKRDEEREHV